MCYHTVHQGYYHKTEASWMLTDVHPGNTADDPNQTTAGSCLNIYIPDTRRAIELYEVRMHARNKFRAGCRQLAGHDWEHTIKHRTEPSCHTTATASMRASTT